MAEQKIIENKHVKNVGGIVGATMQLLDRRYDEVEDERATYPTGFVLESLITTQESDGYNVVATWKK